MNDQVINSLQDLIRQFCSNRIFLCFANLVSLAGNEQHQWMSHNCAKTCGTCYDEDTEATGKALEL